MEIEQVKKLKRELEMKITNELNYFELETGVNVEKIDQEICYGKNFLESSPSILDRIVVLTAKI